MATLDILVFPHILDDVLHQLHLDGQFQTLARCRATCSTVKDVIDLRIPKLIIILQSDSFPDGYTRGSGKEPQRLLFVGKQIRLWPSCTEGWTQSSFDQVVDLHPRRAGMATSLPIKPRWEAPHRIPVLRLLDFDCRRPLPPCSADTLIIFPTSSSHPAVSIHSHIHLHRDAHRIVIHLPYNPSRLFIDYRSDCSFSYKFAPQSQAYSPQYRDVAQQCQEVILVLPNTPEDVVTRELPNLPCWAKSVLEAVYHNSALQVTVLADKWDWQWLIDDRCPEEPWLQTITDHSKRLELAWGSCWARDIAAEFPLTGSVLDRVKCMTKAEYEAHVGSRMLRLMLRQ